MRGKLIALEGVSCSGKTTFLKIMKKALKSNKDNCLFLGGFNITSQVSEITKLCNRLARNNTFLQINNVAEFHLILSEMINEIFEKVIPAINAGKIVFYDNYLLSILAFEKGIYSNDLHFINYIDKAFDFLIHSYNLPVADKTIYIQCPIEITVDRLKQRDKTDNPSVYNIQTNIDCEYKKILDNDKIVVYNDKDFKSLETSAFEIIKQLKEEKLI